MIVTYTGKDLNYPLTSSGKLDFVVVGTGRCGTVYLAKLLSSVGYPCGHETIFQCDGMTHNIARLENSTELPSLMVSPIAKLASEDDEKVGFKWFEHSRKLVADASYMAAPFLDNDLFTNVNIIHVVRNPFKVINSFVVGMNYFREENLDEEWEDVTYTPRDYHRFIYKYVPELKTPMHPASRAALYYVRWNQLIEKKATGKNYLLFKVEKGPQQLFDFLGIAPENYYNNRSASHKEDVPFTYNCYESIPDEKIREELRTFAAKYGY